MTDDPKSVLVIEDEPLSRKLIFHMLREAGYHVEVSVDGTEAIERLETEHFEVLLLDLKMPRLDGIMVTEHLGRSHPGMLARTIVMTAFPDFLKEIDHDAIFAILKKPFTPDTLLSAVERCAAL